MKKMASVVAITFVDESKTLILKTAEKVLIDVKENGCCYTKQN